MICPAHDPAITNTENERILHAEQVLSMFMQVAISSNHVGKNESCPLCHCYRELQEYTKKYHNLKKFKEAMSEEIAAANGNPKKLLLS